uniref:Uncharacterized protein n=1 Tax=Arundo donax TaxID=35708 RepID=A0A0A8YRW1_ARUDO
MRDKNKYENVIPCLICSIFTKFWRENHSCSCTAKYAGQG